MKWTKEKPTKHGWYWWRSTRGSQTMMVEIANDLGPLEVASDFWVGNTRRLKKGEWAGPIEEPKEAV